MPIPLSWSGNYTYGRLKGKTDFIRIAIPIRAPMGLTPGGGITRSLIDTGSHHIYPFPFAPLCLAARPELAGPHPR